MDNGLNTQQWNIYEYMHIMLPTALPSTFVGLEISELQTTSPVLRILPYLAGCCE